MPEHEIRLRAAWDGTFRAGTRRVDLPVVWAPGEERPSLLARRFRTPPLDPRRERLLLRLADVPGLAEVRLDGRRIAAIAPGTGALEVELPSGSPGGHQLELELDGAAIRHVGPPGGWGRVALVIRQEGGAGAVGGERDESL